MKYFRRLWRIIWKEDSLLSWIINVVLAFLLVKFIIYPGLGFFLGTGLPVVAVVSSSMEHNGLDFDSWWEVNKEFYIGKEITQEKFSNYSFKNGFNKGDIMVLYGDRFVGRGDVIVFQNNNFRYPIIHRIVDEETGYITKGDNNQIPDSKRVSPSEVIGKAVFRIPYLGWVKIWFNGLIESIGGLR
jgi:signal peptidase I